MPQGRLYPRWVSSLPIVHRKDYTDKRNSHYVAFIRKDPGWILFNDERVALGGDVDEMKKFAYVYFFRREAV